MHSCLSALVVFLSDMFSSGRWEQALKNIFFFFFFGGRQIDCLEMCVCSGTWWLLVWVGGAQLTSPCGLCRLCQCPGHHVPWVSPMLLCACSTKFPAGCFSSQWILPKLGFGLGELAAEGSIWKGFWTWQQCLKFGSKGMKQSTESKSITWKPPAVHVAQWWWAQAQALLPALLGWRYLWQLLTGVVLSLMAVHVTFSCHRAGAHWQISSWVILSILRDLGPNKGIPALHTNVHVSTHKHTCAYRHLQFSFSLSINIYTHMYIHKYTGMCVYICVQRGEGKDAQKMKYKCSKK